MPDRQKYSQFAPWSLMLALRWLILVFARGQFIARASYSTRYAEDKTNMAVRGYFCARLSLACFK